MTKHSTDPKSSELAKRIAIRVTEYFTSQYKHNGILPLEDVISEAGLADLETKLKATKQECKKLIRTLRLKMIRAINWETTCTGENVNRQCGLCLYRWNYKKQERHSKDCFCRLSTKGEN